MPKTVIHLAKCDVEDPKFNTSAPYLMVTDRTTSMSHDESIRHRGCFRRGAVSNVSQPAFCLLGCSVSVLSSHPSWFCAMFWNRNEAQISSRT